MAILKNEPLFPFKDGDFSKPYHIVVTGSEEEIGYDLACLAKERYDCKLDKYDDPIYGEARREFFQRNWPAMNERSKGVRRAYGLPEDDNIHDASNLPYDYFDTVRGKSLSFGACSAVVLPGEKSNNGKGVFVARNEDMPPLVLWSDIFGKPRPEGAHMCLQRTMVLEFRPDKGYRTIMVGGHDVLTPPIDGINEKGLYFAILADPNGIGEGGSPTAGGRVNGITDLQLGAYILNNCATVDEAKKAILASRIIQVGLCVHVLFVDGQGNATVFEIDKLSQAYVFTDRKPGEPIYCTNHPLSAYPDPSTYPAYPEDAEHNTFFRMNLLKDTYAKQKPPFQKTDAEDLVNVVHCAFVDWKKAQAADTERTLINTNCDLSKPEITVRFYLGDDGPVSGTNHVKSRMSEPFTFGFE